MENQSEDPEWLAIKELIKDWGISHTTLEEVFMKVKRLKYNLDNPL